VYGVLITPVLWKSTPESAYSANTLIYLFGIENLFGVETVWIIGKWLALLFCVVVGLSAAYAGVNNRRAALSGLVGLGILGVLLIAPLTMNSLDCEDASSCAPRVAESRDSLAACNNPFEEQEECLQEASVSSASIEDCSGFDEHHDICVSRVAALNHDESLCKRYEASLRCLERARTAGDILDVEFATESPLTPDSSCQKLRTTFDAAVKAVNTESGFVTGESSLQSSIDNLWTGGILMNYSLGDRDEHGRPHSITLEFRGSNRTFNFTLDMSTNGNVTEDDIPYKRGSFYAVDFTELLYHTIYEDDEFFGPPEMIVPRRTCNG
jgi:hypothetical protein